MTDAQKKIEAILIEDIKKATEPNERSLTVNTYQAFIQACFTDYEMNGS